MYQKIKGFVQRAFIIEQEDISDRYMFVMLFVFILFQASQCIVVVFSPFNPFNSLVTYTSLCIMIGFFILFKSQKYRLLSKILFVIVCHFLVLSFWLSSEGLLGAITGLIPVLGFIVVAIMPSKYSLRILLFTFIFVSLMISIEFVCPEYIVPYQNISLKKIDIIMGIYFTFFMMSFSFWYLRKQYSQKEIQLKKEIEIQKKLNEELDHFVYHTSHDLRAPISSTMGLITLIRMAKGQDEILRYVDLQEKSLQKMDGFIYDILSYAQNNRTEIVREKINFQELYEDTIQLLFDTQSENKMRVNSSLIWDDRCVYYGDKPRIQMMFKNLISNAFRYFDKHKTSSFLHIRVKHEDTQVTLIFEDNGIGIPAESIPKIFDMFYRAHKFSIGSGLGLYIVKQNVIALGGTISCLSHENIGTTFEIVLPKR